MAALANKGEGQHGALRVLLVGEADEKRQEVKAALASLGDPSLEIIKLCPVRAVRPTAGLHPM